MKKVSGTTRLVEIHNDYVIKSELYSGGWQNEKEYNVFVEHKDSGFFAKALDFSNGKIKMERVSPILEVLEIEDFGKHSYMDDLLLKHKSNILEEYSLARDYLLKHTDLEYEEWQCPENWGFTKEGKLVLLDYSR